MTSCQHARHSQTPSHPTPASSRSGRFVSASWKKLITFSILACGTSAAVAAPAVLAGPAESEPQGSFASIGATAGKTVGSAQPKPFVASADVASVPFVELPTVNVASGDLDDELVLAVNEATQVLSRVSGSELGLSTAAKDLVATLDEEGELVAASLNTSVAQTMEPQVDVEVAGSVLDAAADATTDAETALAPDAAPDQPSPSADAPTAKQTAEPEPAQLRLENFDERVIREIDVPNGKTQAALASRILAQVDAVKLESPTVVDVFYERPEVDQRAVLEAAANQFNAGNHANGEIPSSQLCTVFGGTMRCDAAAMFTLMNDDFKKRFGHDIGIISSYRTYADQVAVKASRGHFAAVPGTSNHGLGLALDLTGSIAKFGTAERAWIVENGPSYGWIAPDWAAAGGSKPEPWHYEFVGAPTPSIDSKMWGYYDRVDQNELESVVAPFKLSIPSNPVSS